MTGYSSCKKVMMMAMEDMPEWNPACPNLKYVA
jgi:hypothetical protein